MLGFVAKLAEDIVILRVDHALRDREIVASGKLVEQLALHMGPRQLERLLLVLAADEIAQLVEIGQAKRFGKLVVELGVAGSLDRLDLDREGRRLAARQLGWVIVGEFDLDVALVASLGADQLLLEAGDEAARAKLDRHVLAGPAVEQFAGDLAGEIQHHQVTMRGHMLLGRIAPALAALGDRLKLLLNRFFVRRHRKPFDLDSVDIGGRDGRQGFDLDRDLGILALFVTAERNLGPKRRPDTLFGEHLFDARLNRGVERVLMQ